MLKKTIARVGFAPITHTANGDTYGNVNWLESTEAGGREYSAEPQGNPVTIYSDGIAVVDVANNAGYNISLTLLSLIDQLEIDWLDNKRTVDGGVLEVGGFHKSPRFALLVAQETLDGEHTYEIDTYFNCTAKRPNRTGKTSQGDNYDPDFPQFSITAKRSLDGEGTRWTTWSDTLPTTVSIPEIATSSSNSGSGSSSNSGSGSSSGTGGS